MRATKVNAGLAESNGKLLLGIWRDSLHVTCGLTACRPGSAPGPTLGNEYGKTLPFYSSEACFLVNSQKPCTNRWGPNKLAVVLTAKDRIASATYRITLSMSSMSTADKSFFGHTRSSMYIIFSTLQIVPSSMLPFVSGINFRPLSVNHALTSPVLIHPVLRVALPPSVPSTHHCHHPSPLTLSFQAWNFPFLQIIFIAAFCFSPRTDSTHFSVCLLILLSTSVFTFKFLFCYPIFSCWFRAVD